VGSDTPEKAKVDKHWKRISIGRIHEEDIAWLYIEMSEALPVQMMQRKGCMASEL